VEHKSKRQTRAARQRANLGKPPAGIRLTGYNGAEVIPAEAAIVREIFERFAAGESIVGLVRYLTEHGMPTRTGVAWSRTSVRSILKNPRYAGRAIYQGQCTGKAGAWPTIVTAGLYDVVQSRLDDPRRKTNRVGTDRKYLGSSLFRCDECGGPLVISGGSYLCQKCRLLRTREPIDGYVLAVIRERLARPDVANLLAPSTDARVAELDGRAKELRMRLEAVEADYDAGLIDGRRFNTANEKISAELHKVDGERVTLLAGSAAGGILSARDPVAAFDSAGLGAQRAAIDALLDVRVKRAPRGRSPFTDESVAVAWKGIE
jgi:hypothetical protein